MFFELAQGKYPAKDWLLALESREDRQRIFRRLERLQEGNKGDCKGLGAGVSELRCFFGSGYRVYFGEDGPQLVVLLMGGDKASQGKDIPTAQSHWAVYEARKRKAKP